MTPEIVQSTTPDFPTKGDSNIIDITIKDIPISLIEHFQGIPDFLTAYRLPFPVVIQKDEKFLAIGGFQKVQVAPSPLETARCIEYVLLDNSEESIAIEKIALFVRPAGGSASIAEIIRAVASLIILIKHCPDTTVIEGWGGLRRGKEFEEGETLTQLLADRLGKSPDTARRYIYYGKNLSPALLEELAKVKASRKFFEDIQPKKTKLTDTFTGKSAEEITTAVSAEVPKWLTEFNTPKAPKPKQQDTKQPPGNAVKAKHQQEAPVGQGPQATEQLPAGQQAAGTPTGHLPEQTASPATQQTVAAPTVQPTGLPAAPAGSEASSPDPDPDQDQPTETDDNTLPHEDDLEEETEEANDISPGKDQRPPLYLITSQGDTPNPPPDIYAEMNKIGNKLLDASKEKPVQEALYKKIQEIMADLTTLLRMASEINRSLPTTTLAGAV